MGGLLIGLIIAATLVTAAISSMFGMLGGLMLMAVLVSVMPVAKAMVLHGLIQLTSNGYRAWLNRRDIQWSIIGFFAIGGVAAMALLAAISFTPSRIVLLMSLGLMPYIAYLMPTRWVLDVSKKPVAVMAGGLDVMVNLIAGVAGPLIDIFFQQGRLTRHQVVATKAVMASLAHSAKIVFFGALANSTDNWPSVGLLVSAMLASMLGTRLGKKMLDRMHDKTFFAWTQHILLALGALLIARACYLLLQA